MPREVMDAGCTARRSRCLAMVVALLAGTWALTVPSPAAACSCAPDPPPQQARDHADGVFVGTVTETHTTGDEPMGELVARIAVSEVYGGEVAAEVDVVTAADEAVCGVGFTAGDRWLVYARDRGDGTWSTDLCTRTAALEHADPDRETSGQAEQDMAELGAPTSPPHDEDVGATSASPWWWGIGVVAVGLAGIAVALVRRR